MNSIYVYLMDLATIISTSMSSVVLVIVGLAIAGVTFRAPLIVANVLIWTVRGALALAIVFVMVAAFVANSH